MSAHSGSSQRFRWYATINNFTQEDIDSLSTLDTKELVVAKEEAPTTGTPHLHVYLSLAQKKRLAQMKAVSARAHWEPVIDRQKCIEYCEKDHQVLVRKVIANIHNSQLEDAISILQNEGLSAVAEQCPKQFVLHTRGLQALQYYLTAQIDKPIPKVSWFYGNTGCGKTRLALEGLNMDNIYIVSAPSTKQCMWFDGYIGQTRAVLDDFRPWWCRFDYLLRLLDRYPMQVPIKGGFVPWIPEEIIITSILPPEELFTGEYRTNEDLAQLHRRIHRRVRCVSFNAPTATFSLSSDAVIAYSPDGERRVLIGANQSTPERFPLPSGIPLLPEAPQFSCHSTQGETEQTE